MPLFHLRDLYVLVVIGLIETARRVPSPSVHAALVQALANLSYNVSRQKRQLIENKLERTFHGSLSPTERARIARGVFYAFWEEMFFWAYSDLSCLNSRVQVAGMENLRSALERGHGVILWESNSFGRRLLSKHILRTCGVNIVQVHALTHVGGMGAGGQEFSRMMRHIIQPYFHKRTCQLVAEVIYLDEKQTIGTMRVLAERLAANAVVCVAAEGPLGYKHLTLPFLGESRSFATGLMSLAKLADAPLVPLFCTPTRDGGYVLELQAPIQFRPEVTRQESFQSALEYYVSELEGRIRRNPEWHRSWDAVPRT